MVTAESLLVGLARDVILPRLPAPAAGPMGDPDLYAASIPERVALAALVIRHGAKRVFEIGTFRGVTALTMAANGESDGVVHTLDLPPSLTPAEIAAGHYIDPANGFARMAAAGAERRVGIAFAGYAGPGRIEQLFGNSAAFDFGPYRGACDLFFVDGSHEYAAAKTDTATAWACLRPGGALAWHDYDWPTVHRAVADSKLGSPITLIKSTSLAFALKI
ncbi:class I SAM-dependent methyltransferase [Gemmata sp. G18]|uniref:Class I SAM-dependent methyltransferase n=1 Tax=Gemmata palustris TaxID=2822762 RepID=A0ABS5BUG5_9BACT|nr:class I SAM-dependent methyltransferase [Gemmata palustris]MBP3957346.1 class I SAM-dependent methyltransferase [Gemmata palustris]